MTQQQRIDAARVGEVSTAAHGLAASLLDAIACDGVYEVECIGADGTLRWRDRIENVWCSEGMEAVLTHALKGSAYTAACYLGLISDDNYTTPPAKENTAANITTASGTPPNGWNEAPSGIATPRGTPSFGTASSSGVNSDLATSSAVSFSIGGTDTIKGCFLVIKDKASGAPSSTVGNTGGAILSAGLFSGGDKAVAASDTLNVTYTARLTTT